MIRILSFASFLRHSSIRRILILKVHRVNTDVSITTCNLPSQLRFLNIQDFHLYWCFHLIIIQRLAVSGLQPASALFPFGVQIVANFINLSSVLFCGNFVMLLEI